MMRTFVATLNCNHLENFLRGITSEKLVTLFGDRNRGTAIGP